jgi:hypothetical protein
MKLLTRTASLLLSLGPASTLPAQNGAAARGAETITEALVRRHVAVIADDSMLGRDTPSRGLDLTAQYVADQFRKAGLKPGGTAGSFLQRYPISKRKIDQVRSVVRLDVSGIVASSHVPLEALHLAGPRGDAARTGPTLLLAGRVDSAAAANANVAGRVVLLVVDFAQPQSTFFGALVALSASRASAVVVISNRPVGQFDALAASQQRPATTVDFDVEGKPLVVEVHERTLTALLGAARLDLAELRATTTPVSRLLPDLDASATVANEPGSDLTAPNTVAILQGTDSVLRHEYLVISAHMDHVGMNRSSTADSIWNGADDDASGTAGVMLLAQAFAKAPTKRSIIFLTVSGEEKGLWGSEWFATHPPVPVERMVANLNLDMIGRNWRDTIVVIGKEHSDLGATLDRVSAAHPELRMAPIGDLWPRENFYFRSDHYNFARRGVPILFFFNGTHADYHEPSDSPDKIDAEKEARIVKLVYWIGQEVGNAPARPKWNPESYRKIVK